MCEKCSDIDAKLARYEQLARMIIDHGALESIKRLIANLVAERGHLHSRSPRIRTRTSAAIIDFGRIRVANKSPRPINHSRG
jgi:hypothetical protein